MMMNRVEVEGEEEVITTKCDFPGIFLGACVPSFGLNECIAINAQSPMFICFILNSCTVANCFEYCVCSNASGVELDCNKQTLLAGRHD